MKLKKYKLFNEYYLPKSIFDSFVKQCKKDKNILYGFDVFKKLKDNKQVTIEIADFSNSINPDLDYDYAITLSDKFVNQYKNDKLLFTPVVKDDSIFEI